MRRVALAINTVAAAAGRIDIASDATLDGSGAQTMVWVANMRGPSDGPSQVFFRKGSSFKSVVEYNNTDQVDIFVQASGSPSESEYAAGGSDPYPVDEPALYAISMEIGAAPDCHIYQSPLRQIITEVSGYMTAIDGGGSYVGDSGNAFVLHNRVSGFSRSPNMQSSWWCWFPDDALLEIEVQRIQTLFLRGYDARDIEQELGMRVGFSFEIDVDKQSGTLLLDQSNNSNNGTVVSPATEVNPTFNLSIPRRRPTYLNIPLMLGSSAKPVVVKREIF